MQLNASSTKLNWPRKNGPSSNLERAVSMLSKAVPVADQQLALRLHISSKLRVQLSAVKSTNLPATLISSPLKKEVTAL